MVYDIIARLEGTTKRNEKLEILKEVKGTELEYLFKLVCRLAYEPTIMFYIKDFDESVDVECIPLVTALEDLETIIAGRVMTGNMAKKWVEETYSMLSATDAIIFKRVINRDLRCGISASTINKVWPGLIYVHPYMRCSSFSDKNLKNISFPCYSQLKMDALYCDVIVHNNKVEYRTRSGQILPLNSPTSDAQLIEHYPEKVLQGEACTVDDKGVLMKRADSNGYVNSDDVDPERVLIYVWDVVDYDDFMSFESKVSYFKRFNSLDILDNDISCIVDRFRVVETRVCSNKDDIIDHFRKARELGEEGTIIKDYKGKWKNGTSKHQIKVKVVFDCELKVVGWKEGTGRLVGMLGSIQCESADGIVCVSVGTGYKDDQRANLIDIVDSWVANGQIITVRANDVIANRAEPDKLSLFLPRFVEPRTDKTVADSAVKIQEQVKAFTDALELIK